jgi:hypothetical protein
MHRTMKQGVIAAVLLSGAALISLPASANSVHDEGYFGGGYTSIGPGPYYQRRHAGRIGPLHERRAFVYGPTYYYGYYGPGYEYSPYDYGPGVAFASPGFAIGIY